jgi:DNA-binding transcriptional ArsR family regulator
MSSQPFERELVTASSELTGLRVLAHPLRLQILSLLTGAAFSAMELSRELGISQALASYHMRKLHAAGVIELSEIRAHRGGRERRFTYSPIATAASDKAGHDREGQVLFAEAVAVELRRRSRLAKPGDTQLGVDAELWVDPAIWASTLDALRIATNDLHKCARPPRTPGTMRVSVSALLFSMTD